MYQRTVGILEATVRDYIHTGKPVSSKGLYKKYRFGIKPAMIRSELHKLTKEGYLIQPHISGGRVPTDEGYRFLADKALKENLENLYRGLALRRFVDREIHNVITSLSEELKLLSVGYQAVDNEVYKSGLDGLFEKLTFDNKQDILEVVRDFEMLDERVRSFKNLVTVNAPQVFIGKSPITKSKNLSVIADKVIDGKEEFLVMVIGPKRMNYEKVIKLFRSLE